MIKLVCTDIDGTLVEDGTFELNEEYYAQIKRLKEKGIMFCAASGRPFSSIRKMFEPVLADIYIICDNGACVFMGDKPVYTEKLDRETAIEIINEVENIDGCHAYVSCVKYGYTDESAKDLFDWLVEGYKIDMKLIEKMPDDLPDDDDILCVEMYHKDDAESVAYEHGIPQKWGDEKGLRVGCAGKQWMHINSKNADKGEAMLHLAKILGVKKEEIVAFGDNINDLGMINNAHYSYAIGNARKEVKDAAKYVADTNVNHGVLQVLRTL